MKVTGKKESLESISLSLPSHHIRQRRRRDEMGRWGRKRPLLSHRRQGRREEGGRHPPKKSREEEEEEDCSDSVSPPSSRLAESLPPSSFSPFSILFA